MTGQHARSFRPARCNVSDERLEIVHQVDAVGSIIVSKDHENRIVTAARLQTAAHVEEIAGAAVFGAPQDPWHDRIRRNDKCAAVGIAIDKIKYCLVRND